MTCHVCGSNMQMIQTNLPFKVCQTTIVIVKDLPIFQCEGCSEYLLDDHVMEKVDTILEGVDCSVELEVLKYAA